MGSVIQNNKETDLRKKSSIGCEANSEGNFKRTENEE
jgi:hypothetical protein